MITQKELKSILYYDHASGIFTWLKDAGKNKKTGTIAGRLRKDGYINIRINYKMYVAHRLAWLYMKGKWPSKNLDHKDLNRSNNAWKNIRLATNSQNGQNRYKQNNNTSGFKNVYWFKSANKWGVTISDNYYGLFDSKHHANIFAINKRKQLHGRFAR